MDKEYRRHDVTGELWSKAEITEQLGSECVPYRPCSGGQTDNCRYRNHVKWAKHSWPSAVFMGGRDNGPAMTMVRISVWDSQAISVAPIIPWKIRTMSTILVTGANRGIGLELVRQYAAVGAEVLACCRRPADAIELQRITEGADGKVRIFALDIADPGSIHALKSTLGDTPIDIIINNAAIAGPEPQTANAIDYEQWLVTFRVNTMGPFVVARTLYENLLRGHDKKLVTITSGLGSVEDNRGGGWYGYRASKAALNSIMRGLAHDWAKVGIRVGIISPGSVRTDMGGKNALQSPEESVRHVRQRISELDETTSGQFLRHAGGTFPW
jgi:NAD(P)-dependent dehydrogenase (short-subunit alcohol dehydrogenase family)